MVEQQTYEQLAKEANLLRMSNSALRYSLKKEKVLSMKRLKRVQALQKRLDGAKLLLATATGDEPTP